MYRKKISINATNKKLLNDNRLQKNKFLKRNTNFTRDFENINISDSYENKIYKKDLSLL